MNNKQTLSTTALAAIDNYARAASLTVKAYRAGSSRLLDGVNHGLQTQVYSRSVKLAPNLTGALKQLRNSLSEIIEGSVGKLSSGGERAIKAGSAKARVGVSRMAGFSAKVKNPLLARSLNTAASLSMPGARAALAVSAGLVEGAGRLSRLAGGSVTVKKTTRKTAVRVKRSLASQVEVQVAAAPKKVAAVKQEADKAVTVAKRRVRKVAAAVTA
ncbi:MULTISPECIES: hypothetical protein [Roseateles]|uniref:Phasin family protein n=1 Tax=Roseateles albus TaxID=2987525 RepID=A0ABT5KCM0_9BURK|nr:MULTISPECIES: hypothetical protein [Roseateles]MCV2358824.1 hypothetical protein [Paucibacter sp. TC2R-5]MDC8771304.1 hypothetical protein [Roseateles albus]